MSLFFNTMKEYAKKFYFSKQWKACRKSYISKRIMIDGGLCEECHENPGYIVHHKIQLTPANIDKPNITLSHSNLKYVCKQCHDKYDGHFIKQRAKPKCKFSFDGQPLPPNLGAG